MKVKKLGIAGEVKCDIMGISTQQYIAFGVCIKGHG